ncbi:sulfurtransferase complex subunit TusC [Buchnera aphidicola]|uniref:sulfurtransferase complex subunit TusC n=1 Tax=Buchnera aphidicola TaxID=9 RepID=UPI003463D980
MDKVIIFQNFFVFFTMMKSIAFVISKSIHGSSIGREGLNVVLSASTIQDNIGIFFIGDGVLQIVKFQNSERVFSNNYPSYFLILVNYGIKTFFVCKRSLFDRNIDLKNSFLLDVSILNPKEMRKKIDSYDLILSF